MDLLLLLPVLAIGLLFWSAVFWLLGAIARLPVLERFKGEQVWASIVESIRAVLLVVGSVFLIMSVLRY